MILHEVQQMAIEQARSIVGRKCAELACWHYSARGFIYCTCCLHGRCREMIIDAQIEYSQARRLLR